MANEVVIKEVNALLTKEQQDFIAKYYEAKAQFDRINEELKPKLIEIMRNSEDKELEIGNIKVKYKNGYYRNSVDTNALKEQGIYEDFLKQTYVKDSVSIEVVYD